MNQTLTTCDDFVAHPHKIVEKIIFPDGRIEYKTGNCYRCQCADASERQGINALVIALGKIGISATVEQTGGFTMCALIDLDDGFYIYAGKDGADLYDQEGFDGNIIVLDDEEASVEKVAQEVQKWINNRKENK